MSYQTHDEFIALFRPHSNSILLRVDEGCEMAAVSLNTTCIKEGNFWDFHPDGPHERECLGFSFSDYETLVSLLEMQAKALGYPVTVIRETYQYE